MDFKDKIAIVGDEHGDTIAAAYGETGHRSPQKGRARQTSADGQPATLGHSSLLPAQHQGVTSLVILRHLFW